MKDKCLSQSRKNGLELKNRLTMTPMATRFSKKEPVTDRMLAYYAERAKGPGVSLEIKG